VKGKKKTGNKVTTANSDKKEIRSMICERMCLKSYF